MTDSHTDTAPTAYASRRKLMFHEGVSAAEVQARAELLLAELTRALQRNGCELIGHIKGLIDADDKGYLMFSITSFHEDARVKGELFGVVTEATLTINVIVYGIDENVIAKELHLASEKQFG